jgi:branched-chain amino acid transport system substrate-binding protein
VVVGALIVSSCTGDTGALPDSALPDSALPDSALPDSALPNSALPNSDGADESATDETATVEAEPFEAPKHDLDHLDELTRWAAEFTNGPGIEAVGEPILVGYVHDADLSPRHLPAARAAVEYINEQLGGVGGRPVELVACDPSVPRLEPAIDPESEEEIEVEITCETDFGDNDDLTMVVSQTTVRNAELYEALADKKPVLVASPGDVAELTTSSTSSYLAGTLATGGMGIWALSLELESAVALLTDNVAGRDGFTMLEPMFAAAGVELVPVWITSTTSASRIESVLTAAGAADADLIILGLDEPGCVATSEALSALGVDGTATIIISSSTCLSPGARASLAETAGFDVPANWHFATNGFNPFESTLVSGYATIGEILDGPLQPDHVGDSGVEAAVVAMLSATRALNRVGGDFSHDAVNGSLQNPGGPVPTQAGDQNCGRSPAFVPVCAGRVGVVQFAGGAWIDVAIGDDAIDLNQILFPPG